MSAVLVATRFASTSITKLTTLLNRPTAVANEYCADWKLQQVKTTNMGSLYRLSYEVTLRPEANVKAFIDQLRCHNGNLEISMAQAGMAASEL